MPDLPDDLLLTLEPISGPEIASISLRDASTILGRGGKSAVVLPHDAVSREHLSITRHGGSWFVTDLASRNGTRLGSLAVPAGQPTPLQDGDTLEIKPWTFLVRIGDASARSSARTIDDDSPTKSRLRTTDALSAEPRIRQRFESLLRAAAVLHSATGEGELLDNLLQTALAATGFERAAVIRRTGSLDSVEVVAQRIALETPGPGRDAFHFSRSLLRAASERPYAVVADPGAGSVRPETMVRLDIAAAACAPIRLNEGTWGYLYLDSGAGAPPTAANELLEVVGSLADIASLALANVKQHEIQARFDALRRDFEAAAEIQEILLPSPTGSIGPVAYAFRSMPGRIVSGDIFDVVDLGDGRGAFFLGDVMGKGLGAGLLMSGVRSFLHACLPREDDPGRVLEYLNYFVSRRVGIGRIVSLWLGVIDSHRGTLKACDAGHGHTFVLNPGRQPEHVSFAGGPPLGTMEEPSYCADTMPLTPGQRLVVVSDGVIEQPSHAGEAFGQGRLLRLLQADEPLEAQVERVKREVLAHAGAAVPADDVTVACIMLGG